MFRLNFDGGSRGNPGIAGAGAVIYDNDVEVWFGTLFIGDNKTNNEAEYAGLILGLQNAKKLNIKNLIVQGDSLLIINQMNGLYKCKSPKLLAAYSCAKSLEQYFEKIYYIHVPREKNKRADFLSNKAINDNISTQVDER